jgi:hypothetical protein
VLRCARRVPRSGAGASHRLTPEAVVAELAEGGLAARVVEETLPYPYVVVGVKP